MKVLVIGEHYSYNLGDAIISECFQNVLRERNIEYDLLDTSLNGCYNEIENKQYNSSDNKRNKKKEKLKRVPLVSIVVRISQSVKDIHRAYLVFKNCKKIMRNQYMCAIYDGGSLFMGYFALTQYMVNRLLNKYHVPIYYNACGWGRFSNAIEKRILKQAISLPNIKCISVRDSADELRELFACDVEQTYDIALLSNTVYSSSSKDQFVIGIGMMSLNDKFDINLVGSVKNLIVELEKRRIKWELFTNGAVDDYNLILDLYQDMQREGMTMYGDIRKRPCTAEQLVEDITRYSKIITCRLHCAIVAYSFQIPAIAIEWSKKINDFYEIIDHRKLIRTPVFDADEVLDTLLNIEYNVKDIERLKYLQDIALLNVDHILMD